MVSFTNQFPDLECGYEENGTFYHLKGLTPICLPQEFGKNLCPQGPNKLAVYKEISPFPRILRFQGVESDEFLLLDYHANGDLWDYLLSTTPPLYTHIGWALEIAEGIAYLHSKSVIWVDGHFRNVLVTEDLHVVLADFAFSLINPEDFHWFTTQPPSSSAASQRLSEQTFDTLEDEDLNKHFGHIVRRCLNVEYKTGTDVLEAMKDACENWRRDRST
ncbi:hypothetical protein B0H17DRAFT_1085627, partial [Mycena rosella]